MPARRIARAHLVLVLALALALAHSLLFWRFTVDDAFISFRYASNLVQGHGLVFNPGERVEGYTNFLWTILLAAPIAAGLDAVLAAKALAVLANLATILLAYRLGRQKGGSPLLALPACLLLAANGAFAVAAVNGLETALFTLLITWGAARVVWIVAEADSRNATGGLGDCGSGSGEAGKNGSRSLQPSSSSQLPTSLLPYFPTSLLPFLRFRASLLPFLRSPALPFALAALTRPEGYIIFGLSLLLVALRRNLRRADLRRCLQWAVTFACLYLPYYGWRWWYYGYPFPNTYYAKTGAGLAQYYKGLLDLQSFATTYHGYFFIAALLVLALGRPSFRQVYLAAVVAAFAYIAIYEGGDWIPFFRLLVPALPLYYLLLQEAGVALWQRGRWRQLAVLSLLALALLVTVWPTPAMRAHTERRAAEYAVAHEQLAYWLKEQASGPVALMDIGLIGYVSGLPLLDTSGLTDTFIAHSPGGLIDKQFDVGYILRRAPQYVVLASTTEFTRNGSAPTDFPIEARIFADAGFRQQYCHLFTLGTGWLETGKGYYLAVFDRCPLFSQ